MWVVTTIFHMLHKSLVDCWWLQCCQKFWIRRRHNFAEKRHKRRHTRNLQKSTIKNFWRCFFLEKKFGAKKEPKLGPKAPQFLPPQPFLWIIFFRYQVLVFFLLKNFKRECVTKNTSFCDFVWLDWYLPTIAQWGHFAKKGERHNFLRRPSESINEVNFLVLIITAP